MNKKIQLLSILFLGFSSVAFSQIKEEKLVLNKKREPEVKKIEKKKTSVETIKNYPPEEKSQTPVKYTITDVPAVSDFKTSTIQGEDVAPKFDGTAQNNYFQFGMGNYGKVLVDGNVSKTLENKLEVGADVHVLSTNGLKKDYDWKSGQTSANIGAFLNSYGEKGKFNLNAEYGLDSYNYYGIYAMQPTGELDLKQKVNQFKVNGYYDFYSNEILNDVRVKSSFLKDHFDASENQVSILANFSKHAVELGKSGINLNADLGVGLDAVKTDFAIRDKNSSNFFNTSLTPKVTFSKGDSYLMLGSSFSFLNAKNSAELVSQQKNNKTYWFPQAEFQFAAAKEFKFYGGVDGGLKLNTYGDMLQTNPFILSDQFLKPTETKYHFYVGLRGDIDETLKYDFSAGYGKMRDIMFFKANGLFDNTSVNRSAYNFANTFSAVYDDGNVSDIKGSVQYFPLANLIIDGELRFTKYDLKNYENIYNVPLFNASIGAKYTMLDKKLLLGFKGIFASDRTTNSYAIEGVGAPNVIYQSTENTNDKVGGYADLNLSAEYKIHKNFSIFALGNNLLSSKYQTYKGYKVLGAQILGGVKITF
ncbi:MULTISPECIES: TonB-dependent receptor [Chryseobacterium]|uniref:TonB-dependent receptor n=1 Tax=Chryseobacterium cucumeris TaxID=1813611 RepID=A0ABX9XB11_9FLAO|nr:MULTISPECIES: TonB-dependent receptor [Chryseobacterium]KYH05286.1 TonB-dependent receptor [Chryseobacterium cucumeris]MDH5032829.1 TonB-dependent receptor [Chryseobacterium cucumeris]ROH96440.1 TonB-dependent receptor [Chryseobacterium cucumeris]WFB68928.1 TonB-dependent receptor [Chryseobacterium sp. WX]